MPKSFEALRVKIFADGADLQGIVDLAGKPWVQGITTNPTLVRRAGVTDYRAFARALLRDVRTKPISFEVLSDDFGEMERQALEISSWAENVYVKIPVTNTRGEFAAPLIRRLSAKGVKINVTAVLPLSDVARVCECVRAGAPSFISVFAGRIADTGIDPVPVMKQAVALVNELPACQLIWASPREVLNVVQADDIGCHIITVTPDILKKLPWIGRDLAAVSLDTVKMFQGDAEAAGFSV
jgi:transaldolase